jgi:hypothetical protein
MSVIQIREANQQAMYGWVSKVLNKNQSYYYLRPPTWPLYLVGHLRARGPGLDNYDWWWCTSKVRPLTKVQTKFQPKVIGWSKVTASRIGSRGVGTSISCHQTTRLTCRGHFSTILLRVTTFGARSDPPMLGFVFDASFWEVFRNSIHSPLMALLVIISNHPISVSPIARVFGGATSISEWSWALMYVPIRPIKQPGY